MTDQPIKLKPTTGYLHGTPMVSKYTLFGNSAFTKSNGSKASRVYERLTRWARRKQEADESIADWAEGYRRGVYDALNEFKEEVIK